MDLSKSIEELAQDVSVQHSNQSEKWLKSAEVTASSGYPDLRSLHTQTSAQTNDSPRSTENPVDQYLHKEPSNHTNHSSTSTENPAIQSFTTQPLDHTNNSSKSSNCDEIVQPFNIQLLDISKLDKYIDQFHEKPIDNKELGKHSELHKIEKFMIVFNHKQKQSAEKAPNSKQYFAYEEGHKIRKNVGSHNHTDYSKTYFRQKCYLTRIARVETKESDGTKSSDFVIFYVLKNQSGEISNIFAAATGQAWQVVRSCVKHSFSINIIQRVGSAKKFKRIERHSLFENVTKKEILLQLRHVDLYLTSSLYYLVDNFTCKIDEVNGKELLDLLRKKRRALARKSVEEEKDNIQNDSDCNGPPNKKPRIENTEKSPEINIRITTAGSLIIQEEFMVEDYFDILKFFEQCLLSNQPINRDFDFLHFLTADNKLELDCALIKDILSRHKKNIQQIVTVRHKYLEDFLLSKEFEIMIPPQKRFEDIGSEPPDINTIIEKIEEDDADLENFASKMKEGKLRFTYKQDTITGDIINYIEGEIFYKQQHYFKIRSTWYQMHADYLSLLHQDFEKVMDEVFIKIGEEGSLPIKWIKNLPLDLAKLKNHLDFSDNEMKELMEKLKDKNSRVSYVSNGKVLQKKLIGEILDKRLIKKYKNEIEDALNKFLEHDSVDKKSWNDVLSENIKHRRKNEQQGDQIVNLDNDKPKKIKSGASKKQDDKYLKTIWQEVNKKRYVVTGDQEGSIFVSNPFPYTLKEEKKYETLTKFLVDSCKNNQLEDDYNLSYLDYDNSDASNYLVFDKICPDGIECCDILSYKSKDKNEEKNNDKNKGKSEDNSLYLYQVKEQLGQHTREACSQILNSAIHVQEALRTNQKDNYLKNLWSTATKDAQEKPRKVLKDKLEDLGEKGFMDLFRYRDIVFVYAYLTPTTGFKKSCERTDLSESMKVACEKLRFVSKYGFLTTKFFHTTKEDFVKTLRLSEKSIKPADCNAAYTILKNRSFSNSTTAKMEVIRLAEKLRTFQNRFKFKICEITILDCKDE